MQKTYGNFGALCPNSPYVSFFCALPGGATPTPAMYTGESAIVQIFAADPRYPYYSAGRSTMAVLGGRPSIRVGPLMPGNQAEYGPWPMLSKPP